MRPGLAADVLVGRLRLRGGPGDPLLARLRAAAVLSSAGLAPPGLPPAAVLLVRRLRDPLPGRVRLIRPGTASPVDWSHRVRDRLGVLARAAARPATGPVDDAAEAVLFSDQAELLACLARDWLHGRTNCWWWRTLLADGDLDAAVIRAWLEHHRLAATAIAALVACGDGEAFVRRLPPDAARLLLQAIVAAHGLSALVAVAGTAAVSPAPSAAVPAPAGRRSGAGRQPSPEPRLAAAPWADLLPATATRLSPLRQALLGVSVTIERHPDRARSRRFATQALRWCNAHASPVAPPAGAEEGEAVGLRAEAAAHPDPAEPASPGSAEAAAVTGAAAADPASAAIVPAVRDAPLAAPAPASAARAAEETAPSARSAPTASGSTVEAAAPTVPQAALATRYGGLFFLVNLGLFLKLYGDFTTPARPGIALPVWDYVELVGAALLDEPLRDDPIVPLLARLAGRRGGAAPGASFRPPAALRIPVEWLRGIDAARPAAAACECGRLRVRGRGLVLFDLPLRTDPRRQLAQELRPYIAAGLLASAQLRRLAATLPATRPPAAAAGRRTTVGDWLAWLLPLVRLRLGVALGLADTGAIGRLLLALDASVFVTAGRIDVRFKLAQLPVAVRLAGLDRDPGWVPAAGRELRFHFD